MGCSNWPPKNEWVFFWKWKVTSPLSLWGCFQNGSWSPEQRHVCGTGLLCEPPPFCAVFPHLPCWSILTSVCFPVRQPIAWHIVSVRLLLSEKKFQPSPSSWLTDTALPPYEELYECHFPHEHVAPQLWTPFPSGPGGPEARPQMMVVTNVLMQSRFPFF